MEEKKILIVCATGIATSNVVLRELKSGLNAKGILCLYDKCSIDKIEDKIKGVDLIISTTKIENPPEGIPIIQTLAFITGIGIDAVLDEIANKITSVLTLEGNLDIE